MNSVCGSGVPRSAFRRVDMLLHGGEAARGPIQRRRLGPYGVPCCRGVGAQRERPSPRPCQRPLAGTPPATRTCSATTKPKARCSRAPPPWLEDDTP